MVSPCHGIALNAKQARAARLASLVLLPMVLAACAGLPPGTDFPNAESVALANPEDTHLGSTFSNAARVECDREPARSNWQRLKMQLYALLPISSER